MEDERDKYWHYMLWTKDDVGLFEECVQTSFNRNRLCKIFILTLEILSVMAIAFYEEQKTLSIAIYSLIKVLNMVIKSLPDGKHKALIKLKNDTNKLFLDIYANWYNVNHAVFSDEEIDRKLTKFKRKKSELWQPFFDKYQLKYSKKNIKKSVKIRNDYFNIKEQCNEQG